MKTGKRILAAITTLAVAVAGFFAPAQNNAGINTGVSAYTIGSSTDIEKDTSGKVTKPSTIELVKKKNNDRDPEENFNWATLTEGDEFWVRINIPTLSKAPDTVSIGLNYNASAFELTKWYNSWENTASTWERAGDELHGTAGESNSALPTVKKGTITLLLNSVDRTDDATGESTTYLSQFAAEEGAYVEAKFKVKDSAAIGGVYEFSFMSPTDDGTGETNSWCEASVSKKTYTTEGGKEILTGIETEFLWGDNEKAAIPVDIDNIKAYVSTAASLKGYINIKGYTFDPDDPTKDAVTVKIFSGYIWDTGNLGAANGVVEDTVETKDGYFIFRGVKPGSSYAVMIDRWCRYEDPNTSGVWNDYNKGARFTVTDPLLSKRIDPKTGKAVTSAASTTDTVNIVLNVRLYGDVNGENGVDASDATAILRKVVGKTVGKNSSNEDLDAYIVTAEGRLIANVLNGDNDYALNARDATHILKSIVGQDSIFKVRENEIKMKYFG